MKSKMIFNFKWFKLWTSWTFEIVYAVAGYFRPYPELHISILGLHFEFIFPIRNGKWEDECDPPSFGIMIHEGVLFLHYGGKGNFGGNNIWSLELPFFTWNLKHNYIETENGYEIKSPENISSCKKYNVWFFDKPNNKMVLSTCHIERFVYGLKWLPFIKKKIERLDVDFSEDVGKDVGTWKGGTLSLSTMMIDNESIYECLKRIEDKNNL